MYQYKVSATDTNKAKKITSSGDVEKLLDEINNINKSFSTPGQVELDKDVSFDRLEQVSKTDEQLQKEAENSLFDYKTSTINNIKDGATTKQNELLGNIATLNEQTRDNKVKVSDYYDQARKQASDDALKRGLARSSIVINTMDAFNNAEIESYKQLDKQLSDKVNAINFEISAINTQKENALRDFDIAYAVKLDSTLNKLKQDLADQQTAIIKYNNDIAKAEEDYKIKYTNLENTLNKNSWDKEMDMVDLYTEYGANMLEKYKSNKIYTMVKEYLNQFDSAEAKRILQSNEQLQKALGSKYNTLLGEL